MKKNKSEGFTLVELILYMGIFTIMLVVLFEIFTSIIDVQLESSSTSSVSQDARFLFSRLMYDISQAQDITNPYSLGSSSASLQLIESTGTYMYSITNGVLNLTNSTTNTTDSITSVDTSISNLHFTRLGNSNGKNTIQVGFTLTGKTVKRGGAETQTFQTTIGIR